MLPKTGPLNQIPITQCNLFKVYTSIHFNQQKLIQNEINSYLSLRFTISPTFINYKFVIHVVLIAKFFQLHNIDLQNFSIFYN